MARLLHIDSSPRGERSHSRRLTREFVPLVLDKKMLIITARGGSGFGSGERNEKLNHQDPYLRTILGFIGITDINFIHVENDEYGGQTLAESIANARTQIAELVGR